LNNLNNNNHHSKISVIGIGKLGLPFALILEKNGYDVVGCDILDTYVSQLNNKQFISKELGVYDLLNNAKQFTASTNLSKTINHSDVIFIFLATPSLSNGRYDHSQIDNIVLQLKAFGKQKSEKNIIISCTVMPGYCDSIKYKLNKLGFKLSYNPEFIAQGSIVNDLQNPDMVLIGEADKYAGEIITQIYDKITLNRPKFQMMSPKESEITKIALNCFLTTKIAFANMVGDIAIKSGCDENKILSAIGSDNRIGEKYLKYGFGFGGPCLPRDNRAMAAFSSDVNIDAVISKASDKANRIHLENHVEEFIKKNVEKKEVIIEDPCYKPKTNIIEESQQLAFAVKIAQKGYKVRIKGDEDLVNEIRKKYHDLFRYEIK